MQVLGIILLVVGMVLVIVGRNVGRYLPPGYQDEEDGFLQLLQSVGNLVSGIGIVFLIMGLLCVLLPRG